MTEWKRTCYKELEKATEVDDGYTVAFVRSEECLTTAVFIGAVRTVRLLVTLVAGWNAGLVTQTRELLGRAHIPGSFSRYTHTG